MCGGGARASKPPGGGTEVGAMRDCTLVVVAQSPLVAVCEVGAEGEVKGTRAVVAVNIVARVVGTIVEEVAAKDFVVVAEGSVTNVGVAKYVVTHDKTI